MDNKPIASKYLRYGGAAKSTFEMNKKELEEAAQAILKRVKERHFSNGLPIYFSWNDVVMAEYSDGRIEVVNRG